jgi:hypothetical protein
MGQGKARTQNALHPTIILSKCRHRVGDARFLSLCALAKSSAQSLSYVIIAHTPGFAPQVSSEATQSMGFLITSDTMLSPDAERGQYTLLICDFVAESVLMIAAGTDTTAIYLHIGTWHRLMDSRMNASLTPSHPGTPSQPSLTF